jgi:hypothetical protein
MSSKEGVNHQYELRRFEIKMIRRQESSQADTSQLQGCISTTPPTIQQLGHIMLAVEIEPVELTAIKHGPRPGS